MRARSFPLSLALAAGTVAAGLAIRFAPLALPSEVVKYGGSMLWAVAIYWVISSIFSSIRLIYLVFLAGALASIIEFFKLYHSSRMDAFRLTIPGILLLGRFFSLWDILAYWVGIAAAAALDAWLRRSLAVPQGRLRA
jgi:hypothetical protein